MPEYRRHYHKGGSYFFTVVTHQRQKILLNEDMRSALRSSIQEVQQTLSFKVMPGSCCLTIYIASGPCQKEMTIIHCAG